MLAAVTMNMRPHCTNQGWVSIRLFSQMLHGRKESSSNGSSSSSAPPLPTECSSHVHLLACHLPLRLLVAGQS